MPKNTALMIPKRRMGLYSQNTSPIRNGKPVCPEKNKSLPVLKIKKLLLALRALMIPEPMSCVGTWSGNGPICVSVIKNERMRIKTAIFLRIKGILRGSCTQKPKITAQNRIGPYKKRKSTFMTGTLLRTMSVTDELARSRAYNAAL